ncbi:MAG: peptide chain release factor 1 [Oscillospiraceae bacterium]|nr:peptide chain release factor 1 [Oscillospiraceae bacterium]
MLEKIRQLAQRYEEIEYSLSQSEVWNDTELSARLTRERRELEPLMEAWRRYERCRSDMQTAEEMLSDPELRVLGREELEEARAGMERAEADLKILLLPKDPDDGKNVIVEIRGGVGGEESALFAADLFRMYSMYAERKGFRVEIANRSETELGGIREISFIVQGENAFSRFRFESGVHRVQRVPETETQGRIHTSTCTVAVLPELEENEFDLDLNDVQIDTFRSSGAGGQKVNKTSSAIRVTHIPTGMVVECQDERSQYKNKARALSILASRLARAEKERQDAAVSAQRRAQVGTGMRNERIRTYNFPQGRVTDHRIGLTLYRLDAVMNGDLDELIDALLTAWRAEQLRSAGEGGES